ncbi:MAG TPA: F0F1 ATP synthase subunit A [Candidatus Saccharimonadales bacterium]|nr:F0F1 ATP synthase subunit A [Candidatus Saccharimonadales bacterium]
MTSFAPEPLFHIGFISITNSLLNTLLVDGVLIAGAVYVSKHVNVVPSRVQNAVESIIEPFYDMTETIAGDRAAKIFPYFMSFFLFILFANWSGLLPGVSSIGFFHSVAGKKELVPLLRNATSDINVTFALALISVVATHVMSVQTIGIKDYLGRYFSLNPIYLFVGLLEIVSEFTKIVSLSFRLFGNIFAGEIVLATISGLFAFFAPLPFLLLEVIVGIVQALVFSMLTMVFMSILTVSHKAEH